MESVDATGAGDAFAAAMALGLARKKPLVDAGEIASAAAALTTMKLGVQLALPTMDEIRNPLRKNAA